MDQLIEIIKILGTPTREEIHAVRRAQHAAAESFECRECAVLTRVLSRCSVLLSDEPQSHLVQIPAGSFIAQLSTQRSC